MKKFLLIASAAAMAVTMPALAKPDKENKGGGNHAEHSAKPGKGNDNVRVARGGDRGQSGKKFEKAVQRQVKAERRQIERIRDDRDDDRREWRRDRDRDDDRVQRVRFGDRLGDDDDRWDDDGNRRRFASCPPGLARKNNGCLPPGQAKKIFARGERLQSDWYRDYNLPASYRSLYYDNPDSYYRYDDNGYIYRVNRQSNLVSGLIPLLGGGFGVGQMLPAGYDAYNVPIQYRDTYYDTPDAYYRYGDNAIYQVDPQSNMIESVVALLTGNSLGVGQALPAGYDAYNLPLQYRDQYYDTDQSMYRYADGNIFQVDPQTQIIQAVISALI
jgi:hypothetical protein